MLCYVPTSTLTILSLRFISSLQYWNEIGSQLIKILHCSIFLLKTLYIWCILSYLVCIWFALYALSCPFSVILCNCLFSNLPIENYEAYYLAENYGVYLGRDKVKSCGWFVFTFKLFYVSGFGKDWNGSAENCPIYRAGKDNCNVT